MKSKTFPEAAQLAAELAVHHIVTEVSDVPDHAGNAQAAFGHHAMGVKVTAMKVGVGHDGTARHLVESDVLGIQIRRAGHHHRVLDALRVLQRPAQGLHAA